MKKSKPKRKKVDHNENNHGHENEGESGAESSSEEDDHHYSNEPEELILDHMEDYYNSNYKESEVMAQPDFIKNRIFSVTYDKSQDIAYIFVGKIKQLCGKKLINFKIPKSRKN